jgi:hypothetical protein
LCDSTIQNSHFLGEWFYKAELWDMTYYARIWSLRISRFEKVSSALAIKFKRDSGACVTAAVKVLNKNEVLASRWSRTLKRSQG